MADSRTIRNVLENSSSPLHAIQQALKDLDELEEELRKLREENEDHRGE